MLIVLSLDRVDHALVHPCALARCLRACHRGSYLVAAAITFAFTRWIGREHVERPSISISEVLAERHLLPNLGLRASERCCR